MSDKTHQNAEEPFGGFGKTFGRRKGRPLRAHHASLVEKLLPRIEVKLPEGYLDRLDDTPPRCAHAPEELEAFERALQGG